MADLEGIVYLVVQRKAYPASKRDALTAKRATVNKPESLDAGQVVVKFRVSIPEEAFKPLEATDLVVVPLENVIQHAEVQVD